MRNEPYAGMGNVSKAEGLYLQKTKREKKLYKPKPTSIELFTKKVGSENYVLSPKSYNFLTLKTKKGEGTIKLPNYSTKEEALIDLVFNQMAKELDYGEKVKDEKRITVDDLIEVYEHPERYKVNPLVMWFETSEIRKLINVPYWKDREIVKATRNLRKKEVSISSNSKVLGKGEDKLNRELTLFTGFFNSILVEETTKLAPRTKNVQHRIGFVIEPVTELLFYNDIIRRRFSLFPTKLKGRLFYRTKHGIQKLYRYLSLWNYTALTIPMVCDLLQYSKKTEVTQIINRVEGYLNEMKSMKLIKFWRKLGKGSSIVWQVFVTKEYREDFRRIAKELQDAR